MLTLSRLGRSFRCGELAPGTPYVERDDRPDNRLDDTLSRIWGQTRPLTIAGYQRWRLGRFVRLVDARQRQVSELGEQALRRAAHDLRGRLVSTRASHDELSLAFALAREAARRQLGMFHFPVQVLGGAAMLSGAVAEMQTGEGKTLTAVLPAVAAALIGRCVHVVTVNDYLARRDGELLRPVYAALGLETGIVEHGQGHEARRRAYACDITYCTNKELVFDYLRDRLALGTRRASGRLLLDEVLHSQAADMKRRLLLRGLHFAIVDEADSVLIDEARTPLILSGTVDDAVNDQAIHATALNLAGQLKAGHDFKLMVSRKAVHLTDHGEARIARLAAGLNGLWSIRRARNELVRQAISALHLFERDAQYIVTGGKVQIVDEFTGRTMPDRSWQHGLQQLIETKEGCARTGRTSTLARITYQRFFRRYRHLCGMTGTATETAGELYAVYGLPVVRIPTNRPLGRVDTGTRLLATTDEKWAAVVDTARTLSRVGRAVLIGTRSVEASEHIGRLLAAAGLAPVILNARQDRREAEIIAAAGRPGRVTVATNMAGRGTDISLAASVRKAGGLHVILTEYHESRRIDRQLFGRSGRQGDPGSYCTIVALDDELFRRFAGRGLTRLVANTTRRSPQVPDWLGTALRVWIQSAAERLNARERRTALAEENRFDQLLGFATSS